MEEEGLTPPPAAALDLGHWLRATRRLHSLLRGMDGPPTFTPTQFAVMLAVCQVPGADQRTIAVLASIDQATVSQTLRRLVRDGYAEVVSRPDDGRRLKIAPAPGAQPVLERDLHSVRRADEVILAPLDPTDRMELIDSLRAVAYSMSDDPLRASVERGGEAPGLLTVGETSRAFGRLVRICGQHFHSIWAAEVGAFLTPQQFTVLSLLEGRARTGQGELIAALSLDKATMTGTLRRLTSRGLVTIESGVRDKRQRVVAASPLGRDVVKVVRVAAEKVENSFTEPASDGRLAPRLREVLVGADAPPPTKSSPAGRPPD